MKLQAVVGWLAGIAGILVTGLAQGQERAPRLLNTPPVSPGLISDSSHGVPYSPLKAITNPWNRTAVVADYNQNFLGSSVSDEELGWTGSLAICDPGTSSTLAQNRTIQRINYYRRLVGLPDNITFDPSRNAATQAAALLMGANNNLSHSPLSNWLCYTPEGYSGASNSNLGLGSHSSQAVEQYMDDEGGGNTAVGHRRWILYSRAASFGSGNARAADPYYGFANVLWVFNAPALPAFMPSFVAYPPTGYVPRRLMAPRWSFSLPGANFSAATVTVKGENGVDLSITKQPVANGYGDNTLVWDLNNSATDLSWNGSSDKSFAVTVSGVLLNGVTQPPYAYTVVAIDPSAICPTPSPAPTCSVATSGGLSPYYGVESVRFHTISSQSSSAADDGANYLNLSCATQTTVTAGNSYSLVVKGYYINTHTLKAWIDFNGNGSLTDPGELILTASANSASVVVTIPPTARQNNPLRLRIMADGWNGASNTPCSLAGGGQVEDYAVWVQPVPCSTIETIRDGNWNDPAIWSCGRVPATGEPVRIGHTVTIAAGSTVPVGGISYGQLGKLVVGPSARLVLGH